MSEQEWECRKCRSRQWIKEDAKVYCRSCRSKDLIQLSNDNCNVYGRELWGRREHEMGACSGCMGMVE